MVKFFTSCSMGIEVHVSLSLAWPFFEFFCYSRITYKRQNWFCNLQRTSCLKVITNWISCFLVVFQKKPQMSGQMRKSVQSDFCRPRLAWVKCAVYVRIVTFHNTPDRLPLTVLSWEVCNELTKQSCSLSVIHFSLALINISVTWSYMRANQTQTKIVC